VTGYIVLCNGMKELLASQYQTLVTRKTLEPTTILMPVSNFSILDFLYRYASGYCGRCIVKGSDL